MNYSKFLTMLIFLCFILVIPLFSTETDTQTKTFEGIKELDVSNVTGDIEVSAWDKDYVEVTYQKRAEDEEKLDDIEIIMDKDGDLLTIDTDMPRHCRKCNVNYTISIPSDFKYLEANTVTGDINCRRLGTVERFEAKSTTGDIDAVLSGNVFELNVVTGDIDLQIGEITGNGKINIETITGSILVVVPDNFDADIYLSTITGSVDTNFDLDHIEVKKRNKLDGTIGKGDIDCSITAITGSIDLRMK